jgi:hypothetical protein
MDAENKKEQTGTPLDWVGTLEGGFGGWVGIRGVHPKKYTCLPKWSVCLNATSSQ